MASRRRHGARGSAPRRSRTPFAGVKLNQRVIELNENQPEFSRAIWDYMDGAVSADRVARGRSLMRQNRKLMQRAEKQIRRAVEHRDGDLGA